MTGKIGQKLWFNTVDEGTGEVTTYSGTLIGKSILDDAEQSVLQIPGYADFFRVPDTQVYASEKTALDARVGLVPPPTPPTP